MADQARGLRKVVGLDGRVGSSILRSLPGFAIILFSIISPTLRRADGSITSFALAMIVGGVALALYLVAYGSRWERAALYLGITFFGQVSSLMLVDAPNYGVLQHYMTWDQLWDSGRVWFLMVPLLQTGLLVVAVHRSTRGFLTKALSMIKPSQAIVVGLVLAFSAVNLSRDLLFYLTELILSLWLMGVNGGMLLLTVKAVPDPWIESIGSWVKGVLTGRSSDKRHKRLHAILFPWSIGAFASLLSAAIAWFVFEGIPHIPDSVAFLFQAKYFAAGELFLPSPQAAKAFEIPYAINDGMRWYGYSFLGWPAVLAIGAWLGASWLVNPILAGITVVLTHRLIGRLYSTELANLSILFLAFSPWFLFMSASHMTHPSSLVWGLVALLALEYSNGSRLSWLWGGIAGVSLGLLFLTRPLEGILMGAVAVLWRLKDGFDSKTIQSIATTSFCAMLIGGVGFLYNKVLTGAATYFPMARYFDEQWYPGANRLGFGSDIGNVGWWHVDPLPGHGPLDVIINTNQNAFMLNTDLFGWGFGSLIFLLLFLSWKRWNRSDWLMVAIISVVFAGNTLYYFSGAPDFGARYWYQMLVPMVVLTIRGVQEVSERTEGVSHSRKDQSRLWVFVGTAAVTAALIYVPWRSVDKYHNYRGMRADLARMEARCGFEGDLVLIQERDKSDYPSAFVFNPNTLDGEGTLYARDQGPEGREALASLFPEREVWIFRGSEALGGPFTFISGPIDFGNPTSGIGNQSCP